MFILAILPTYIWLFQFPSYFMGIGGPASNFDPPHSYWAIPDPHGGGAS
jgi:hypothetical protein